MSDSSARNAILTRLKKEMNGAVVGSMEERGIIYSLNYGVSIPTIRSVAIAYAPDHELALELFASGIRELMIAALYIDDPVRVTPEQMRLWSERFTNPEIVENAVSVLLWKSPSAAAIVLQWISSDNRFLCYGGLLMASRLVRAGADMSAVKVDSFIDAAVPVPLRDDYNSLLSHGVVTLLGVCAAFSERSRQRVLDIVGSFSISEREQVRSTATELKWRIES